MRSLFFQGRPACSAFALVTLGIALLTGGLVGAQEERPEVRLVVEGGIDGWVDPQWPVNVTVRIETDVLLVGELQVVQGRELARLEVEVPADGVRTYEVVVAPPEDQGAILLRVIPDDADDDEPVASAFFRPRIADEEILVGLVGLPRLEQVLGEVRSAVSGDPITPIGVEDASDRLERGEFHQLSYLVLDQPRPLPAGTVSWLKGGGRLVTTSAALETMELDVTSWGRFPGVDTQIGWYGVEEGEVLALDSLTGLDTQVWAKLLRPSHRAALSTRFAEEPVSLTRAALSVETQTPEYLWVPIVVVVYAVLVGPVNLWVLRRRRRLEWAWFTIPVLGLVGVVAFWIVGAGGVNQTFWSHGTVQVAGPSAQTRSAVVAATSRARTLELSFNSEWDVFPEDPDRLSGDSAQPTISEAGVYEYQLSSLGWLSVNAFRRGEPNHMEVALSEQGVAMTNASSSPVIVWGVHAYPKVVMGGGLEPGLTGFVGWDELLASESWWTFGDAFWENNVTREAGSSIRSGPEVIRGLETMAQRSGMVDVPFYAFAVVEEPINYVEVDRRRQVIPGLKLVLVPISAERMGRKGWAFARTVWLDEAAGDFDFEGNRVFAEQWILSYRLPIEHSAPTRLVLGGLDPQFWGPQRRPPVPADDEERSGELRGWEAWDWSASEFVGVDIDQEIDRLRFVAPSGEVLMKVSTARVDMPAPVAAVMMWGDWPS